MKSIIRKLGLVKFLLYYYHVTQGYVGKYMALHFPLMNARSEMKRQRQTNVLRPVCFTPPIYFNEKMLWLKYFLYNKSDIVGLCYNKYLVREYIEKKGLSEILNQLYFKADSIEDIPWESLPDECVIKLSNGYAGHVFKRGGEPFIIEDAKKTLLETEKRCRYAFNISGDLFAYKTKPVYVCEKLIKADKPGTLPSDYKLHCFHGKPMFLEYIHDRDYSNKNKFYSSAFIDIINMKDRYDLEGESSPITDIKLPQSFDLMLKYAQILSQDFPYVRVDFYEENAKPIFGELTFTPYHSQTKTSLEELGRLIDLDKIEKYKEILKVK